MLLLVMSQFEQCVTIVAINGENAVHRSDKFMTMATRTRHEYLRDLAQNYVSATVVDSGSRLGQSVCQSLCCYSLTLY